MALYKAQGTLVLPYGFIADDRGHMPKRARRLLRGIKPEPRPAQTA